MQTNPNLGGSLTALQNEVAVTLRPSRAARGRLERLGIDALQRELRQRLPLEEATFAWCQMGFAQIRSGNSRGDRALVKRGTTALVRGLILISRDGRLPDVDRRAVVDAAEAIASVAGLPPKVRSELRSRRNAVDELDETQDSKARIANMSVKAFTKELRVALAPTAVEAIAALPHAAVPVAVNTAEMLLRSASLETEDFALSEGDKSQSSLRIARVELANFRGVVGEVALDLTNPQGDAVSLLLYGENGTGKSSFVDGVEMALQGRVGRSANFDSTAFPRLWNLAGTGRMEAAVVLSDGTAVRRRMELSDTGQTAAIGPEVSPGFRWAPLTLKRQDIVRFLDTEALSRGTVLFDYFPGSTEAGMGARPDERLQQLEETRHRKRIERQALARELAPLLGADESEISSAGSLAEKVRERLLGGREADEALADGTWESIPESTRNLVTRLRTVHGELSSIRKQVDRGVEVLNPRAYARQAAELRAMVRLVGDELTRSFLSITRAEHVERIDVLACETGPVSLDIVVRFRNGETSFPQQVFSEGYRDLLALLFFLAVSKVSADRGQAKILILDDVFQSVDAGVRFNVMRYVLDEFKAWQLILTLHDRLWLEQLRALLQGRNHAFVQYSLFDWEFTLGPRVGGASDTAASATTRAISERDTASACAASGRLLEQICDQLSMEMRTSVSRAIGDKYTLGDLWPGIAKVLGRSELKDTVSELNDSVPLRNLVGAHYNAWAEALPWTDAKRFAELVLQLHVRTYCQQCRRWLRRSMDDKNRAKCTCGGLDLSLRTSS